MPIKIDETGNVYGQLTVVSEEGLSAAGKVMWLCRCSCGKSVIAVGSDLRNGRYKSCGCAKIIHGLRKHPLYRTWGDMLNRCHNPKFACYPNYGGRGIHVCQEWRDSVGEFISWCLKNGQKPELQLDRIDNDRGYCPENCRFVTRAVNIGNARTRRDSKTRVTGVHRVKDKFVAQIQHINHKGDSKIYIGRYTTLKDAIEARNNYISQYGLPNKLSVGGEYE